MTKTKQALQLLKDVGALEDAAKAKASRNIRRGKGKMRNRCAGDTPRRRPAMPLPACLFTRARFCSCSGAWCVYTLVLLVLAMDCTLRCLPQQFC